jgi:hypothetical protein
MKFNSQSPLNSIWFGAVTGIVLIFIITSVIIVANSSDYSLWFHYANFFEDSPFGALIRTRVLLSVKGGAIATLLLFYLFLNKKMYQSVKGVIISVIIPVVVMIYGYFVS